MAAQEPWPGARHCLPCIVQALVYRVPTTSLGMSISQMWKLEAREVMWLGPRSHSEEVAGVTLRPFYPVCTEP